MGLRQCHLFISVPAQVAVVKNNPFRRGEGEMSKCGEDLLELVKNKEISKTVAHLLSLPDDAKILICAFIIRVSSGNLKTSAGTYLN